MTSKNFEQQPLQIRAIQRRLVHQRLAMAAAVALLTTSCYQYGDSNRSAGTNSGSAAVTDQNANEKIPAVFYKTTEECEADVQKQQAEYDVLKTSFESGELSTAPTEPPLKVEDCEPQMLAAQQDYQKHAPTYASLADCQAEGLDCEPSTQNTGYYQPRFGGYYFYPFFGSRTQYVYINDGGSQRRLYQPSTVYQSSTPGQVVTPNGRVVNNTTTGRVEAPRHTTATPPSRPKGTAARGAVTGRGSQGFGSTYKGTGRGGK